MPYRQWALFLLANNKQKYHDSKGVFHWKELVFEMAEGELGAAVGLDGT